MRGAREKILQSIDQNDHRALFMEGGCQFYALVLQEQLSLPLFYASFPDCDAQSHVFAMKENLCLDYEGKKAIADVAKKYSGWADVPPRPVTSQKIREDLQRRGIADLEEIVIPIAKEEFNRRRSLYA